MRVSLKASGFALVLAVAALPAFASSPRVFMSQTGNDANDCSNPLTPCIDFNGALAQVASGGEVIALESGPYGTLTITQPVTISGPNGIVLYSHHTVTVNAPAATVVLRGLTIDGAVEGHGIHVTAVGTLHIENCIVHGSVGHGLVFASAGKLYIKDSIFRNNNNIGVWITGAADATVDHCRFDDNAIRGIENDAGRTFIRDSTANGNAGVGFIVFSGRMTCDHCLASGNGEGFVAGDTVSILRVANSTATDNSFAGFHNQGTQPSFESMGNNLVRGNTNNVTGVLTLVGGI